MVDCGGTGHSDPDAVTVTVGVEAHTVRTPEEIVVQTVVSIMIVAAEPDDEGASVTVTVVGGVVVMGTVDVEDGLIVTVVPGTDAVG